MKIDILIDNNQIDIDQSTATAINLSLASIDNPGQNSVSFTKEFKLPMTNNNRRAFNFVEQIQGIEQYNNAVHKCTIMADDSVVMSGNVTLKNVNLRMKQYTINVIGDEIDWVVGAQDQIRNLKSDEGVVYALTEVQQNASLPYSDSPLIRFIPVDRGAFYNEDEDGNLTPRKTLVLKDYHPFLNVWGILSKIFANYKLNCPIEEQLKRLYFPGAITENEDSELIEAVNEFLSGRDDTGHVMAGGYTSNSIIDTVKSKYPQSEIFDNGVMGYMPASRSSPDMLIYTPNDDLRVKFELTVEGQMNLPICFVGVDGATPATKGYFDVGNVGKVTVGLSEDITMIDVDSSFLIASDISIIKGKISIFNKEVFAFIYLNDTNNISHISIRYERWVSDAITLERIYDYRMGVVRVYQNQKVYAFKLTRDYFLAEFRVYLKNGTYTALNTEEISNSFGSCLYGTAEKIGNEYYTPISTIVESKIYTLQAKTSYNILTQFRCDNYYSNVIVDNTCQLVPKFITDPVDGDFVTLDTIGGETTQIDFIQAIKQMYNLMFYTNTQTKELIISPANYFVKDTVVDWRNRVDYSKDIIVQNLGDDIGRYLKLNYREGNDVVKFNNYKTKTVLGEHNIPLSNQTKTEGTTLTNPMFMPSITRKVDGVVYAPQLVREKEQQTIEETDFNIDPIIVEVVPNTDETIPAQYRYPIAAFSEYGAKLSFGTLNSYYSKHTQLYNKGKKITAYLRLTPTDVSNIRYFNESMQDFRAKFLLHINGEDIACELQSIQDYNPRDASTKCEFIYGDYFVQDLEFQVTPADILIGVKAGRFSIQIKSNSEWTIESDSWLTPNITTGLGNATIDVSYTSYSDYKRIGYINVQSTGITKTITITQKQSGPM